jgi:hypothetical protein
MVEDEVVWRESWDDEASLPTRLPRTGTFGLIQLVGLGAKTKCGAQTGPFITEVLPLTCHYSASC